MEQNSDKVLVLRTSSKDRTSYGGFQWPESGPVSCSDWNPDPVCGGGLHGLLWGEGDWGLLDTTPSAVWQVVSVDPGKIVDIGNKVKFPTGEVVYSGSMGAAVATVLCNPRGNATKVSSGNYSTAASSGYYSKAASSGDYSKAASSGDGSKAASSGNYSTAASSGNYSTAASSGDGSKAASSGNYSTAASSGNYSKAASSGDSSTAASSGDPARRLARDTTARRLARGTAARQLARGTAARRLARGTAARRLARGTTARRLAREGIQFPWQPVLIVPCPLAKTVALRLRGMTINTCATASKLGTLAAVA